MRRYPPGRFLPRLPPLPEGLNFFTKFIIPSTEGLQPGPLKELLPDPLTCRPLPTYTLKLKEQEKQLKSFVDLLQVNQQQPAKYDNTVEALSQEEQPLVVLSVLVAAGKMNSNNNGRMDEVKVSSERT